MLESCEKCGHWPMPSDPWKDCPVCAKRERDANPALCEQHERERAMIARLATQDARDAGK